MAHFVKNIMDTSMPIFFKIRKINYFPGFSLNGEHLFGIYHFFNNVPFARNKPIYKFLGTPPPNFRNIKKSIMLPGFTFQQEHFCVYHLYKM